MRVGAHNSSANSLTLSLPFPLSSPDDGGSPLPLKLVVINVSYCDATLAELEVLSDNHCWWDAGGVGPY